MVAGCRVSPLATGIVTAGLYYPLATAMAALATAQLVRRNSRLEGWHELPWFRDLRSEHLARLLSCQAVSLSVLAVVFTRADIEPKTVVTMLLAAVSLGLIGLEWGWPVAAAGASLAWATAGGLAAWVAATRLGCPLPGHRTTSAAIGLLLAAFTLWGLAGRLRRDQPTLKGRDQPAIEPRADRATRPGLARAVEGVVLVASILAGVVVFMVGTDPGSLGGGWTAAGIGVLMARLWCRFCWYRAGKRRGSSIWLRSPCWARTSGSGWRTRCRSRAMR